MARFEGKTALVTGGARGQGGAIAAALAHEGCDVAIWDVPPGAPTTVDYPLSTKDDLIKVADSLAGTGRHVRVYEADVRSISSVEAAFTETLRDFGRFDAIVCAAGIRSAALAAEMTDATWADAVDTNLHGTYHTVRVALPHLVDNGGGAILVLCAEEGRRGAALLSHYSAAAWAQIGFAKSIAWEAVGDGVSAVVLCTAAVETTMSESPSYRRSVLAGRSGSVPVPAQVSSDSILEALAARHPTGAAFVPMDMVVSTALYCLEHHRQLTGSVIDVSLGLSATNAC
jgi:NAD(P)-dependent dehydrogenase (short-subunit alcohol dehydrogenase family)